MAAAPCASLLTLFLLFPALPDPQPDDRGRGFFGVLLVDDGGASITRVEPGSPADKAGLRINDVIQAIDLARVPSVNEAREAIARLRPGSIAQVEVLRGGSAISIKVKVGVRPESMP